MAAALTGIFLILDVGFQWDLNGINYSGTGVPDFLTFVQRYSNLYYGWYITYALAAVFGLVFLLAIYIALSKIDKGFALIGTVLGIAGVGVILSNISNHFYLISEAVVYDSGCTVCASQAITGATATFSVGTADTFAGLLISVAMIILSIVIIRGNLFNRGIGWFGVAAGILGLVVAAFSNNYYLGFVPTVALAVWMLVLAFPLFRLSSMKPNTKPV